MLSSNIASPIGELDQFVAAVRVAHDGEQWLAVGLGDGVGMKEDGVGGHRGCD